MSTLSLIAAVAENYVIGVDGDLPWKLPADLRWFVQKTRNKPIVFGRKTFESTGYLPGRTNIVISSRDEVPGADVVVHSIDAAIDAAGEAKEVMILGGATIYEEFLGRADRFYLTVVHARPEGDTRFPAFDDRQWRVSFEERREPDDKNALAMTFYVLEREVYGAADAAPRDLVPARYR